MDTPGLAETRDRACPYCRSHFVVSLGHVEASIIGIRSDYRCPTCAKEFVLLLARRLMIKTELNASGAAIWRGPRAPREARGAVLGPDRRGQ